MAGRPSTYSIELADKICELIALGESLRFICEGDDMPDKSTVFRWLRDVDAFRDQYARAREAQAEHYLDEIMEIADDGSNDFMTVKKGNEEYEMENKEWTSRSKLRVDARKWAMSKLAPKKYGDKLDLTSGGDKIPATMPAINVYALAPPLAANEDDVEQK